jgi:hypothetical protein
MRAGSRARARGQALTAFSIAALVAVGAVFADREGPKEPAGAPILEAASGVWLCPHGGGPGWEGRIAVANPGTEPVSVRLTTLAGDERGEPTTFTVPAGGEVLRNVPAQHRSASSYVEVFGGWAAAGWVVRAGDDANGIGAEPCAPAAARTWYAPELTTLRGEQGYLVVMNPFAADAVFDVALYTPARPPFRDPDWIDLSVPGGGSAAFRLDKLVPGEDAVAAEVSVKSGRVAVSTLGISETGGVRSTLGIASPSGSWFLPTAGGAGQDSLVVFIPGESGAWFGTTLLSERPPQPAGGLIEQEQAAQSASVYQVTTAGVSSVDLLVQGGQPVAAALRSEGSEADDGSTPGVAEPATSWLVLPVSDEDVSGSSLLIVNPGNEAVDVTLRALPAQEGGSGETITLEIPPASVTEAPGHFLQADPGAAVLVRASGQVVALGAAAWGGRGGAARYGLALGVPVPPAVAA